MNIFGKIAGLLLGFFAFGPLGLIVGLALGHLFDVLLERQSLGTDRLGDDLIPLLFSLFGRVAGYGKHFSQAQAMFLQTIVIPRLDLSPWRQNYAVKMFRESLEEALASPDSTVLNDVQVLAENLAENFFLDQQTLLWIHATCRQLAGLGQVRLGIVEILDTIALSFGILEDTGSAGFSQNNRTQDNYQQQWSSFRPASAAGPEAYQVLGLSPQASVEEIKKAYRSLVREYHPDRWQHLKEDDPAKSQKTEKFINLQHAYERLRKDRGFS